MGTRLISLFGVGPRDVVNGQAWDEVRYEWGTLASEKPSAFMPEVLEELYPKQPESMGKMITSVVVLGTPEAGEYYRSYFLPEGIALGKRLDAYAIDLMAAGSERGQQSEAFARLVKWLSPRAIDEPAIDFRERARPDEIIVDITHGLKPQALIAGAAVIFAVAEAMRKGPDHNVPIRIVYGRHNKGEGTGDPDYRAPIWDLTEFVQIALWTFAVQAVRLGRAGAAQHELSRLDLPCASDAVNEYTTEFGATMQQFADALVLLRAKELQDVAPKLTALLEDDKRSVLVSQVPALGPLLDDLESDARLVTSSSRRVLDRDGLAAMVEIAALYGRMERFAEQACALREAYVTLWAHLHLMPSPAAQPFVEPGHGAADGERRRLEGLMEVHLNQNRPPAAQAPRHVVGDVAEDLKAEIIAVRNLRNDLLHFGLRSAPTGPVDAKSALEVLTASIRTRVQQLPLEVL